MASARSGSDKEKLDELKDEIGRLVAEEGGKIDASKIRTKYKERFGKTFPASVIKGKLTHFVKEHMSNDVEVVQEGKVNFIKSKTKRKDAKNVKAPEGRNQSEGGSVSTSNTNPNPPIPFVKYNNFPNMQTITNGNMLVSAALPSRAYQNDFPSLNSAQTQSSAVTHLTHRHVLYRHTAALQKTASSKSFALTDNQIKKEVDQIVNELSQGHYVEVDLVKIRLFEKFKAQKPRDLGNYNRVDAIPGIRELLRMLREVNASIQAFVMVRSVSTLYELNKHLASLYSKQDYEELKLGPLVKHPLVYEYFKFPSNLDPPEITTLKVMKYLRQFMRKNRDHKINMAEFLSYLTEQMSCETPFQLGVKIDSIALMIKCIAKCGSSESTTRREAEGKLLDEIAEEIEQQMSRRKRQLLGSNTHDPDALVNKLLTLSPVDVLEKLFEYCENLFQGKAKKKVTEFVRMCVSDKPSRKLFQLALHKSCRDLVKPVDDLQQYGNVNDVIPGVQDRESTPSTQDELNLDAKLSCPTQQELLGEVRRWLVGKSSRSVDLKLLSRVEESILQHYKGFATFKDLGHGSFLQFLSQHKELEDLISVSGHSEERSLGVRESDVIDLLQQCDVESDKIKLHSAVRAQYMNLSSNLDERLLDGLIARARERGRKHTTTSSPVIYEVCLVASDLHATHVQGLYEDTKKRKKRVGVLGYQDENNVLNCLYQTPLLGDFVAWSEWDTVFAPMYGDLKSFIRKNSHSHNPSTDNVNAHDLVAMETSSGSLLRITRITSTDDFSKCAKRGDVIGTTGHLVSLVFQHGGAKGAPLALLASHMKDAFLSLNAVGASKASEESSKDVIKFAIRCLSRLPPLLRYALGMKIFIEPLKNVFGNGQTPELVLKFCETFEEKSMIHSLGIRCGVSEWQEDFKRKFELTESRNEVQEKTSEVVAVGSDVLENKPGNMDAVVEKESVSDTNDGPIAENQAMNQNEFSESVSTDEDIEFPGTNLSTSAREQECCAVVDSIRRDEFGIGIEFPPEHRQMMENQRSREGRGLHRLSSELYSKDTHFVLELVQNADDNRYSDNRSQDNPPSIAFFVNVEKIVVFNNEVGFEEKNIRALCDVGKSTKGKQRYGYIGQKGIGFKSVFRITDTPEVHSNGYHIKFDAKSGPTGYILPHWCGAVSSDEISALDDWTTRIVLPLKEEMKDAQKRTLIARFHDIQPSLLLFLRRLRRIKIHDEVSNTTREMFRRDCGDKLIEIKHSSRVDLWFVVKKELSASNMKEDIESTEIALAFPLPPRNSEPNISLNDVIAFIKTKSLIQQPVFAFLPLRSYGFRFIIQADFDVPSSREDVDKDSAWNQWLRQEIAGLFVQAFDDFKDHECFLGVASIVQLLQFVPLEDEIVDFFKPLTQTILEGIARKQCIPVLSKHATHDSIFMVTKSHSKSEIEIQWVFPSQVVVADDDLIEELIGDQILNRYLNKYYLHPDLTSYVHAPLRRVLGIETISCQHLIDIGKTIASEVKVNMDNAQGDTREYFEAFARWVANWLCGVYRCLERERDCSDETLHEIAQISIFPLSKGLCTPVFGKNIFLPLEDKVQGEQGKTKASRKAAEIVHRELLSLHPLILTSLDDIRRPQVRRLLERLQVKCLTSRQLIKHHIIPALQAAHNKSVNNPDVIYSYIFYIKDQWDLDPSVCDLQQLRSCALIKSSKGFVNPSLEPVHFTIQYGNNTDLQNDFPSVPWAVVDDSYISSTSTKESRITWEKFLAALGVVHFLAIERKDVSLSKSELSSSIWSSLCDFWPQATGSHYTVKDYGSNELEILLSAGSTDELRKLAEILDQHWDEMYSKYTEVPYHDEEGKVLGQTFSSFFLNLKEKSWLPTTSSQSDPDSQRSCPRNVFMHKPEVVKLLGDHTLYAAPSLVNVKFLEALGIQTCVRFDTLVSEFVKWVDESRGNEDLDGGFTTSLAHITNVYEFLENHINNNDERKKFLEDVIKDKAVVFVPDLPEKSTCSPQETNQKNHGKFLPRQRLYWSDPSTLMQGFPKEKSLSIDPRRMLKRYYPTSLEHFFIEFLGVDATPTLKEYITLLESIASQSTMASGPIVDNMMRVYDAIASKCFAPRQPSTNVNFAKRQLLNLKVFPTMEEGWVSLEEKPLFNDNKSFAKLFKDNERQTKDNEATYVKRKEETVHFIKMGLQPRHRKGKRNEERPNEEAENSRIRKNVLEFFRDVCDIRSLSECVSQEIVSTVVRECPAMQSFLFRWIPYIQRSLYWSHPEHHEKLQESGMARVLSTVKCLSTTQLEVVYRLATHPQISVPIKKASGVENKDESLTFYTTDNELKDTGDMIKELAQLFVPPDSVGSFSNFLHVLTQMSEDKTEHYMESQNLDPLPDDVLVWTVPEPRPIATPMEMKPPDEHLSPDDSVILADHEGPSEIIETHDEPRGLQCWPPKCPGTAALHGITNKAPATEQALTDWLPPAPPDAYVSPQVEAPAIIAQNGFPSYPPPTSSPTTSQPTYESHVQPAVQVMQAQPNANSLQMNLNVSANDKQDISNAPARIAHDDVTHQQRPQYVRPLNIVGDVRLELEEVALGAVLRGNELISSAQSINAEDIGRWGEECVYILLKTIEENKQIDWVNEVFESGLPYDIVIKGEGEDVFIEVKSTSSLEKHALEISSQEIKCAFEKQENYHLYRVYNAGNPHNCRVARLRNLASNLDSKAVSLLIVI